MKAWWNRIQWRLAAWLQSFLNFIGVIGCGVIAVFIIGGVIYLTVQFFQTEIGKLILGYWVFTNCFLPLLCVITLVLLVFGAHFVGQILSRSSRH